MSRRSSLLYVLLFSSFFSFSQEDAYTLEDGLNKKLYLKIYPLYSIMNRYSAGVEYFYKKNRSIEIQSVLLFKHQGLHDKFQKSISNVIFLRKGIEVFVGVNFLKLKKKRSVLNGVCFSYKYTHISNDRYWYSPEPLYSPYSSYSYLFSQTRNQFSLYYKRSVSKVGRRFSFDLYAMGGFCLGYSRNTVFYFRDLGYGAYYPMQQMDMKGLSNCNGAYAYPEIKLGFCPRFRLN